MAGITLETAEAQLAIWLAASTDVAGGQSVTIDGKNITRADLGQIQNSITFWDTQVKRLTSGGMRVRGVTPG